LAVVDGMLIKS